MKTTLILQILGLFLIFRFAYLNYKQKNYDVSLIYTFWGGIISGLFIAILTKG